MNIFLLCLSVTMGILAAGSALHYSVRKETELSSWAATAAFLWLGDACRYAAA